MIRLTVVVMLSFAIGAGATAQLYRERPADQVVRELERKQALLCWHRVATGGYINPAECPPL